MGDARRSVAERWKPIRGFKDRYSISDHGRVRSEERRVRNNPYGGIRLVRERILAARPVKGGYLCVWLYSGDRRRLVFKVADLVARAFVGPKPRGLDTCHDNGVNTDNKASNLKYGTRKQNMADAKRHGTWAHGERHGNAKLSDTQVRQIIADPRPSVIVAFENGISYSYVRALKKREKRQCLEKT